MAGASVSVQRLVPARLRDGTSQSQGSRTARGTRGAYVAGGAPALHARGVGQILDTALDVLVARFGACVGIAAACWIPYQIANEVLTFSGLGQGAVLGSALLSVLPEVLTSACVCSLVGAYLLRDGITAWAAVRSGVTALFGILIIAMAQGLFTIVLACMCVLPMVFGYWLFAVGPTVYVLERKTLLARETSQWSGPLAWIAGIILSIRRGAQMVLGLGSFGRWAGWTFVAGLTVLWPLVALPGTLNTPEVREFLEEFFSAQGRPIRLTVAAISAVFAGIGSAYFAILKTVYYVDQRVRVEALDLELRLRSVVERSAVDAGGSQRP